MQKKKKCPKCGYQNGWDAAYCGLCYEPLNRKPAGERPPEGKPLLDVPAPPGLASPTPPPRPWPLPIKIGFLLLGLALVASLFPALPAMRPGAHPAAANRYKARTDAADKLLDGLIADREKLLAEIAAAAPDPAAFGLDGKYTARMVKLEEDYAAGVAALGLPPRSSVDREKDSAYLAWTGEQQRRENEAYADFSRRYQQHIQRALGGK